MSTSMRIKEDIKIDTRKKTRKAIDVNNEHVIVRHTDTT